MQVAVYQPEFNSEWLLWSFISNVFKTLFYVEIKKHYPWHIQSYTLEDSDCYMNTSGGWHGIWICYVHKFVKEKQKFGLLWNEFHKNYRQLSDYLKLWKQDTSVVFKTMQSAIYFCLSQLFWLIYSWAYFLCDLDFFFHCLSFHAKFY